MYYSVIIPTYKRHADVMDLLRSLSVQEYKSFEVIVCDNGPDDSLRDRIKPYQEAMPLKYLYNKDLRASGSRNWGAQEAKGDFLVFVDSDCIVPPQYLNVVDSFLKENDIDAYGGPDNAHEDFSSKQKAINYSMTSFYTTGGIRGGSSQKGKFQPRSFNMGVKRDVFLKIGGFKNISVAEDIDLSIRLEDSHCRIMLIREAYVYHKRRASFRDFFRQVFAFGMGRYNLTRAHNHAIKLIHLMPSLFVIYFLSGLAIYFISVAAFTVWLGSMIAYSTLMFFDSCLKTKDIVIGMLSVYSSYLMLLGYGTGMIWALVLKTFERKS